MRQWKSQITALGLACAGLLLAGAPAFAQMAGGGSFGGSGSSGGLTGSSSSFGGGSSGGALGGALGGSALGGSGLGGSGLGGSGFTGGTSGASGQTSRTGSSSVPGGNSPSAAVGATSFLGSYYGNPLAQGIGTGTTSSAAFGTPLFTIRNAQSTASVRSTANQGSSYYGTAIGVRRLPAYATRLEIRNMPPPETPMQVRTDLQTMITQSTQLDPTDAVRVSMDGRAVVLRGVVADGDERRLVENMVLLTPGVNVVHNELTTRNPRP